MNAILTRTAENIAEHYGCSLDSAQQYIDLREEGYSQYQAALMAGIADPHDDGSAA